MEQASFASFHHYAEWANADHKVYNCNAWGRRKPEIIKVECAKTDYLLWADSDAVVKTPLKLHILENIMAQNNLALLAGVDYKDTNSKVHHKTIEFVDFFNDGIFAVNCKHALMLLTQWSSYTKHMTDDQLALQLMARSNSIFSQKIKYDFMFLGTYSKYFAHYAGAYRGGFPKKLPTKLVRTLKCPPMIG